MIKGQTESSKTSEKPSESIFFQIEKFTSLLEQETRKSKNLDSKILLIQQESEKPKLLQKSLKTEIFRLEQELAQETKNINSTKLENNLIKAEIDQYRKYVLLKSKEIKNIQQEITKNSGKVYKINSLSRDHSNLHLKSDGKLLKIRVKSAEFQKNFERKASDLTFRIKKSHNTRKEFLNLINFRINENEVDPIEAFKILKNNENIWQKVSFNQKCEDKRKELAQYIKFTSELKEQFNEISNITGIVKFEEIANTFIKIENQEHEIKVYFNEVSYQIEKLLKINENIDKDIESQGKTKESLSIFQAKELERIEIEINECEHKIQVFKEKI